MPMIAAADGTQLFCRDWGGAGAGGSSPVVMIHGWPLSVVARASPTICRLCKKS